MLRKISKYRFIKNIYILNFINLYYVGFRAYNAYIDNKVAYSTAVIEYVLLYNRVYLGYKKYIYNLNMFYYRV